MSYITDTVVPIYETLEVILVKKSVSLCVCNIKNLGQQE